MITVSNVHKKAQMIAHRGLSSAEPENTLPAFIAAGNRSYFGIETDVHKTVDGFYVVTHDDTTKRVANQELEVARSTFAQLRELPLKDLNGKTGRIDLRIPTLDEYLDVCRRYGKVGVLELKNEYPAQDIREILQIVKKHYALENMVFISFVWENLVCLQREEPSATAQFLTEQWEDTLPEKLRRHRFGLDINYRVLTEERVKAVKEKGITLNVWTCDDPGAAKQLISWGIDQITSNRLE